jgi:thiosulfate reductase cytochrome b subunit
MCLIVGFLLVHLALVVLFPRTLISMLVGLRRDSGRETLP